MWNESQRDDCDKTSNPETSKSLSANWFKELFGISGSTKAPSDDSIISELKLPAAEEIWTEDPLIEPDSEDGNNDSQMESVDHSETVEESDEDEKSDKVVDDIVKDLTSADSAKIDNAVARLSGLTFSQIENCIAQIDGTVPMEVKLKIINSQSLSNLFSLSPASRQILLKDITPEYLSGKGEKESLRIDQNRRQMLISGLHGTLTPLQRISYLNGMRYETSRQLFELSGNNPLAVLKGFNAQQLAALNPTLRFDLLNIATDSEFRKMVQDMTPEEMAALSKGFTKEQLAKLNPGDRAEFVLLTDRAKDLAGLSKTEIDRMSDADRMDILKRLTADDFKSLEKLNSLKSQAQSNISRLVDGISPQGKLALLNHLSAQTLEAIPGYARRNLLNGIDMESFRQLPREKRLAFADRGGLPLQERLHIIEKEMSASELAKLPVAQRVGLFFTPSMEGEGQNAMKNVSLEKRMALLDGIPFEEYKFLMEGTSRRAIPVPIHIQMLNNASPQEIRSIVSSAKQSLVATLNIEEIAKLKPGARVALLSELTGNQLDFVPPEKIQEYLKGLTGADSLDFIKNVSPIEVLSRIPVDLRLEMLRSLNADQIEELSKSRSRVSAMSSEMGSAQVRDLIECWSTSAKCASVPNKVFVELLTKAGVSGVSQLSPETRKTLLNKIPAALLRPHVRIEAALKADSNPGGASAGPVDKPVTPGEPLPKPAVALSLGEQIGLDRALKDMTVKDLLTPTGEVNRTRVLAHLSDVIRTLDNENRWTAEERERELHKTPRCVQKQPG